MRFLADENIPHVRDAFQSLGEVVLIAGRDIDSSALSGFDALLVRSVTTVDQRLLVPSKVRFVASATSGIDHVDAQFLRSKGISFRYAPGSNATSVGNYIVAALLEASGTSEDLSHKSLGIIGLGNVGRVVFDSATSLGLRCVVNDPPLASATAEPLYRSLEETLACDIVTLHVALEKKKPYPTVQMANREFFDMMNPGSIFINTSRGAVVDEQALMKALDSGRISKCIIDVWNHEPDINQDLLRHSTIATPHIAGYSLDGKLDGTQAIYDAACEFLGVPPTWRASSCIDDDASLAFQLDPTSPGAIARAVRNVYDIMADDAALREARNMAAMERSRRFDNLRRTYPPRREFSASHVSLRAENPSVERVLRDLGFEVSVQKKLEG